MSEPTAKHKQFVLIGVSLIVLGLIVSLLVNGGAGLIIVLGLGLIIAGGLANKRA